MKVHIPLILLVLLFTINPTWAQKKNPNYVNYIEKYNQVAIDHMNRYKIPASITLSQGILESGAGMSEFVQNSNNHFGIKCHQDWDGERIYRKDDGPRDCFRKYKNAKESFEDHSRFLTEKSRYKSLFDLKITNYSGWAKGLQECGYATDKAYANKLIDIIERYELYRYDSKQKTIKVSNKETTKLRQERDIYKTHGLIYVIASANDSFESIAYDLGFKLKDLVKYNEVPQDFPLNEGDIVYLEKKKKKADKPYHEHIVKVGESMHSISQKYGIRLSNLYKMNKKDINEYVPEEGDVLRLR